MNKDFLSSVTFLAFGFLFFLTCLLTAGCQTATEAPTSEALDQASAEAAAAPGAEFDNFDRAADAWVGPEQSSHTSGGSVELGSAVLAPTVVTAASRQRLAVRYTAATPVQAGGGIQVYFGYGDSIRKLCPMTTNAAQACGYLRAVSSNPEVTLNVAANYGGPPVGIRLAHADVTVASGTLQPGDRISLLYGANSGKAVVQEIAGQFEVTVLARVAPAQPWTEIAASPVLTVRPQAPVALVSAVNLKEGAFKLSVVDRFANLVDSYHGEALLTVIAENGEETPWGWMTVAGGLSTIPLPELPTGYYALRADLPHLGLSSQTPFAPGGQQVYFGDLHFHSKLSDASVAVDPAKSFAYAKNVALIDFLSLTDHAEFTVDNELFSQFLIRKDIGESWLEIQRLAAQYKDGGLVSLLGFEVTFFQKEAPVRQGHMNVYYPGDAGKLYTFKPQAPGVDAVYTHTELWQKLDRDGADQALTIQHHTLRGDGLGSDFSQYDPNHQRLVEIFSHHGCSESTTCHDSLYNSYSDPDAKGAVQRAIGPLGYRLGFTGGSDNHVGHPAGTGLADPALANNVPGGLTGVVTDELNRASLWQALQSRSVYATSGARIYLEFSANGQGMGAEIGDAPAASFQARVIGTTDVELVELFKYDATTGWQVVFAAAPVDLFWNGAFDDPEFYESSVYYLKVTQSDGHAAWSSPIWLDK